MSWKAIVAGTSFELPTVSATCSSRSSGTCGDRDVGLDRRERVVAGLGPALGQRVEEGRLARVGQPDDSDLHLPHAPHMESGTIRPRTTPSRAPGEDVGRVVHPEVGTAERERDGERRRRAPPAARPGPSPSPPRTRRSRAPRGSSASSGAPPSGGSPSSTGRGRLHDQLDHVVETRSRSAPAPRRSAKLRDCAGSKTRQHDPDPDPDRAVVARPCPARFAAFSKPGRVPASPHRAQEL